MRLTIYRNTRVFLIVASLTINAANDANTENSRLYTSSVKFASNSNERRCSLLNEQSKKINRKIKIFLIIWLRNVTWRRRRNNIRMLSFDVIRILFRRKNLLTLSFFFCVAIWDRNLIWWNNLWKVENDRSESIRFDDIFNTKDFLSRLLSRDAQKRSLRIRSDQENVLYRLSLSA